MKQLFPTISLLNIINTTLKIRKVLNEINCTIVVPVLKVNNPTEFERAFNLTPLIININTITVVGDNRFVEEIKFLKSHVSRRYTQLEDIDESKIVLCVFIDLKRAFEMTD